LLGASDKAFRQRLVDGLLEYLLSAIPVRIEQHRFAVWRPGKQVFSFSSSLSVSAEQLRSCQSRERLSQLRDTGTMMHLEALQKNYGKAGEYSKELFDQAQTLVGSAEDPALRNLLRDILATRDQITADLAKGDAAALLEIQPVLSKLEQTANH
jgi:hypothetical protein